MLPIWFTNDCAIARSDDVLVSAGEFANIASICLRDRLRTIDVGDLDDVPADHALACCLASSK